MNDAAETSRNIGTESKSAFRGTIAAILTFSVLSLVVAWFGWTRGHSASFRVRVNGPSMVPTLLGQHFHGACPSCGRSEIPIDATVVDEVPSIVPCFLCGGATAIDSEVVHQGDLVLVEPIADSSQLSIGQLVAIDAKDGQSVRVKRIVALGGQEVGETGGRLLVDGQRIEDRLHELDSSLVPRMLIADSSRTAAAKSKPRWIASDRSDSTWQHDRGHWSIDVTEESGWLVYHHVNVHEGGNASSVMDDYEYNASLLRKLNEVDRLHATAEFDADRPCDLEFAYWTSRGIRTGTDARDVAAGIEARDVAAVRPAASAVGSHDARYFLSQRESEYVSRIESTIYTPPVTRKSPIAVRIIATGESNSVRIRKLSVWKFVEYRLRRTDDRSRYPMRLASDEYFVVGDNVPVSIDSRDHGPIRRDQIIGIIKPPE